MKLGRDVGRILVIFSLLLIGYIASAAGVCDPNNIPVIKYASPGDAVYLSVSGLQPNGASVASAI